MFLHPQGRHYSRRDTLYRNRGIFSRYSDQGLYQRGRLCKRQAQPICDDTRHRLYGGLRVCISAAASVETWLTTIAMIPD
jgi:hypothetical protein